MAHGRVTVFGGSGFLGRQIVQRLAAGGAAVRVAVRHPGRVPSGLAAGKAGQVTAIYADVWDEPSVGPALEGSDAVINTVGHYVERGKATFEAIHGHGAMHVAAGSGARGSTPEKGVTVSWWRSCLERRPRRLETYPDVDQLGRRIRSIIIAAS